MSCTVKKVEDGTRSDAIWPSPRRFLLPKCNTILRYTRECNLIYAQKKSTALLESIFTELTSDQHRYVPVSYRETHPNRIINVAGTNINGFTHLGKQWILLHRFS